MSKKNKKSPSKKKFYVEKNESLDECLARIQQEGYQPVRRMEKPLFIEKNGQPVPEGREIIFEAKKIKDEHSK
ncbi:MULTISPECIES: NETI motif-containing protein [Gracilibacillus]|uniref:NETI motif-containing protein n=1 Tax=Gracilibacillus TaxID=74385 RepID=UPI000826975B|nr:MULTISPECIES: NETI motif-containing protein [Gracilibacillus]